MTEIFQIRWRAAPWDESEEDRARLADAVLCRGERRFRGRLLAGFGMTQAAWWKVTAEAAAYAWLAFDLEAGIVSLEHVLHDGESEPCAAFAAGTTRVDAIEALREPVEVFLLDADPRVLDCEVTALLVRAPAYDHLTARRRVFHGVHDQVRERAVQLVRRTAQIERRVERHGDRRRVRAQGTRLASDLLEQPGQHDLIQLRFRLRRFEARQL